MMRLNFTGTTHRLCLLLAAAALLCGTLPASAEASSSGDETSQQTTYEITGKVTDETGQPMIGVTVRVVGDEARSTTTLLDGTYKVKLTSSEGTLEFSFVGYKTETIPGFHDMELRLRQLREAVRTDAAGFP